MSAPGPEQNQGASQEINQLRAEVARQTPQAIVDEVMRMAVKASEVRRAIDASVERDLKAPDRFEGNEKDKTSLKGKAVDTKQAVQKVLLAVQGAQAKELVPQGVTPDTQRANSMLRLLSTNVRPEDVTEVSAPYLYSLINRILSGEAKSADSLAQEFSNIRAFLAAASPEMYKRVQKALIQYATQGENVPEAEAKRKFFLTDEEQHERKQKEAESRQVQQLTPDTEKQLGDLLNKARSKFDTVAQGDAFVRSMLNVGDLSDAQVQGILESKGFEQGEIADLTSLSRVVRESRDIEDPRRPRFSHLRDFELLTPDLLRTFTVEGLKNYLEDVPGGRPGQKRLSQLGKRTLKKQALYTLNRLMSKVDNNPETDFHSNFSDLREGQAYFELQTMVEDLSRQVMNDKALQESLGPEGLKDLNYFISKGVTQELARERSLRELFHTMGIYIKTLGPDKISEFVARYNLSDIDSIVTSDFGGKLVSLAMSEYERYLKFDITKNKGQLRTSLFAGNSHLDLMYKDNDDRTNLIERLRSTLQGLQKYVDSSNGEFTDVMCNQVENNSLIQRFDIENIQGFEDWELERALKYAQGIQLTQTIRGFEVIASSRPPSHFRGSTDNMVDMAGILNPHWKWQLGRGGLRKMPRYREALVADMIVKRPEKNFFKRVFGDTWDPAAVHEKYKAWNEDQWHDQWDVIKDKWLYKDTNFQNMIKLLGLGGLASRHGWRLTGFTAGVDARGSEFFNYVSGIQTAVETAVAEQTGKQFNFSDNWIQTYEQLAKSVGVGSRFFFDINRATDYAKAQLWNALKLDPANLSSQEKDELWDEYTYGKYGNKEIITLAGGEKITAQELIEVKGYVFRGMNFQALLERSPMDFLNNLINITPDLMPRSMGGDRDDFYFIFDRAALEKELHTRFTSHGAYEDNLKKVIAVQNNLRRSWGENNDDHLRYIRKFYGKIYEWGRKDPSCKKPDGSGDREKIFEKMYREMDLAVEKVRLRNDPTMKPSDILDPELRDIMFGGDGLVPHFKSLNEDFGVDIAGKKDISLGQKGFFYHMGRSWYNELGNQFVPDTTDVDWRFILHNMGANSGENMVKRLWGDLNGYNGVMSKLMGLDDLLAKCAHSHSLEELYKLHSDLRGLKGIAGDENVYEMQYYIAQVAARYFQENHYARMPFLLGQVYSFFNGKELSLSKIYGGKGAMSLTTDGINTYFQYLQHNDFIAEEGIYGFQRLSQALGADWQKLVITEIIPNAATALTLFLLWKYMKDAIDESEGKKKK